MLVTLTVMSWCLVIFQETKKRVVDNIPPIEEEKKEEEIERPFLAAKEEEKIERPFLAAKEKEERTNTLKKEIENTSLSPWVVEVCATLRYNEAKNLVSSFKDQGFPAYISCINLKRQKWYRVRVGRYSTEEEAQKMKERIAKDFGITDSWVHLLRTQTPRKIFE